MQCKPWVEIWLVLCTLCVGFFLSFFVTVTWGDLVFQQHLFVLHLQFRGKRWSGVSLSGRSLAVFSTFTVAHSDRSTVLWVRTLRDEQVSVSERPSPAHNQSEERCTRVSILFRRQQKRGARHWGKTTPLSPSSSSGGGSSTCGETAPPTGGSEVLQADEYIKGLLLWTVQSFSCCFNAACPVPSVEQVSYRILRPWMAQGPNWGEKHHTQSYSGGEGELTAC